MVQWLLIASLALNVNYILKTDYEENNCYECDAYENFLEEWHNYDELRQEQEEECGPGFEYSLPPDETPIEEPPTEEI